LTVSVGITNAWCGHETSEIGVGLLIGEDVREAVGARLDGVQHPASDPDADHGPCGPGCAPRSTPPGRFRERGNLMPYAPLSS
jgi:hypothetical protein